MTDIDALKCALRDSPPPTRRERRASRLRARALSPARILLSLLAVPVVAASVTVSVYVRTSTYAPGDALRHLVALTGCAAAKAVKLAPAREGELGYHVRNDPDGDGVACPLQRPTTAARTGAPTEPGETGNHAVAVRTDTAGAGHDRMLAGGAKFIRP